MNEFLIPSGIAYFPGNDMELLKCIGRIDGILVDDHNFKCVYPTTNIPYGKFTILRIRGRIRFVFRCNIERSDDSCKIKYKVYPDGTFILAFLIIAYAYISSTLRGGWQAFDFNVFGLAFTMGIMLVAYIVSRSKAIHNFVSVFEEYSESNLY